MGTLKRRFFNFLDIYSFQRARKNYLPTAVEKFWRNDNSAQNGFLNAVGIYYDLSLLLNLMSYHAPIIDKQNETINKLHRQVTVFCSVLVIIIIIIVAPACHHYTTRHIIFYRIFFNDCCSTFFLNLPYLPSQRSYYTRF